MTGRYSYLYTNENILRNSVSILWNLFLLIDTLKWTFNIQLKLIKENKVRNSKSEVFNRCPLCSERSEHRLFCISLYPGIVIVLTKWRLYYAVHWKWSALQPKSVNRQKGVVFACCKPAPQAKIYGIIKARPVQSCQPKHISGIIQSANHKRISIGSVTK